MPHQHSLAAEELLDKELKVLDKGFIRLVDYMGTDQRVVDAARVSYQSGTKKLRSDEQLLRYLLRHKHCYTPEMQVLTTRGWVRWDECNGQEEFLIPNPETRRLQAETLNLEVFNSDEEVYCFENARMSFRVTPEHRMWFKAKDRKQFSIVRIKNMSKWGHFQPLSGYTHISPSTSSGPLDITWKKDPQFQLIGFYLGDGCYNTSTNRITFHLRKERKKKYLVSLLEKLAINYDTRQSSTYDDATVFWVEIPNFMRNVKGNPASWMFCRTSDKSFPLNLAGQLTSEELYGLLDGLIQSDGSIKSDRQQIAYYSTSKQLLDLFELLCARIGVDAHRTGSNRSVAYCGFSTTLESRKQYFRTEHYQGKVYCATSSTGLLMVRGGPDKFAFVCGNTTPFEKVRFEFHVKLPIFVARQWMRHRTGCLGGDVKLNFDLPKLNFDLPSGKLWKKYSITVEELHKKWNKVTQNTTRLDKQGNSRFMRDRIKAMRLRSYDEETGEIYHTHIKNIWHSGEQEVFEVTLETGTKIQLTDSHQILTGDGWTTLGEARREDGFTMVELRFAGKELEGLPEAQFVKVISVESIGVQMTYDLEVDGPFHNFSANNIIVHNSFNEMSARYSVLKDEFYLPDWWREQSSTNRQGSGINLDRDDNQVVGDEVAHHCEESYKLYNELLDDNIAREQARMTLPINIYTQFYWTVDLWNLMHFMKLRSDSHAQFEIQEYSKQLERCVNAVAPNAYQAFVDYVREAENFSRVEVDVLQQLVEDYINITKTSQEIEEFDVVSGFEAWCSNTGMNTRTDSDKLSREFKEFLDKINISYETNE